MLTEHQVAPSRSDAKACSGYLHHSAASTLVSPSQARLGLTGSKLSASVCFWPARHSLFNDECRRQWVSYGASLSHITLVVTLKPILTGLMLALNMSDQAKTHSPFLLAECVRRLA